MVELHLPERQLPVVGAVVDLDDLELLLEQFDRRQDAITVQPVRIEVVGVEVRGRDDADAVREQRDEQAVQDHRVGHVGDVELVEADQPEAPRDAPPEFVERVDGAFEVLQFAVHLAHELVEVQARLAQQRHFVEEAVHQEALAAADAADHVDATRDRRVAQQFGDRVRAARLVVDPFVVAALQRSHGAQLRRVARVAALGEQSLVGVGDAHDRRASQARRGIRSSASACRPRAPLPSSLPRATGAHGRCARCPRCWP